MDAIVNLKLKAIKDYLKFLKRLEMGYIDDYSNIMNIMFFIQSSEYFDKPDGIYEYLMNN